MRKLFVLAVLSLAAFAMGVAPASAGWFCHGCCCGRLGACATQYNAFSPYCVTGVYTSHHCHRCMHPANGPCCGGYGGVNACDGGSCATNGESAILGELPALGAPGGMMTAPPPPAPSPVVPGAPAPTPGRNLQPMYYQPTLPVPAYWNN